MNPYKHPKLNLLLKTLAFIIAYINLVASAHAQVMVPAPTQSQNYVITYTPQIDSIFNTTQLSGKNIKDLMVDVAYFDGLGRPLQKVQMKGSPAGNDVVQPFEYDANGRESTKYLPYVGSGGDGSYKVNALTNGAGVYSFYNPMGSGISGQQQANGVVVNPKPYSKTLFELSPLNRVLEQGAPGDAWQPANGVRTTIGRTIIAEYTSNNSIDWQTNNGISRKVRKYNVTIDTADPDFKRQLTHNGAYGDNQLSVSVAKDENWIPGFGRALTTEEYKDKEGRVILKRNYMVNDTLIGGVTQPILKQLSTYYVYDNLGNLAFVLPPNSNPDKGLTTTSTDMPLLNALCYQYQYDEYNRLINKHLPGRDWEETIYNKLDQVVFTQDGNQRIRQERSFYKYDVLGRLVISGVEKNHTVTRASVQANVNASFGALWETRSVAAGSWNGYTNNAAPGNTNNMMALAVNYYDDYANIGFPSTYTAPSSGVATSNTGLLTASKVAVLPLSWTSTPTMLWKVMYYDDKGRNIQTYAQHYLAGTSSSSRRDVITTTYDDFTGRVLSTTRLHYGTSSSNTVAKVKVDYDYDHMGRKINTWEAIANGTSGLPTRILLSKLEYNEIGQLKTKRLHATNSSSYNTFLQNINYTYNERGWLSQINDPSIPYSASNMFSQKLNYNNTSYGTPGQYNGNIAEQVYNSQNSGQQYFQYYYDGINRLLYGVNYSGLGENIKYDDGGNILELARDTVGVPNLYRYTYSGNQLSSVTKNNNPFRTYGYDANGNATTTGSITSPIIYNMLNLPATITSRNLNYTYDAGGNKLRKVSNGVVTEYISGIQYDGTAVDFIQTEEGRAIKSGTNFRYEYTLTDHLGNNRVTFDQSNGKIGEEEYHPFGLNRPRQVNAGNKYLYNGKERQGELNQYDYGARFYDPVIGRWTTVDPLAEKYRRWSPYNYGVNNPLRYIDPDGMGVNDWVDRGGKITWDDKITSSTDKDLQKGDVYLGKNVIVGYENRDKNLNEPINSAKFEFYSETDHTGPVATAYGNTVPADVTKYGTLRDGVYPAEVGSRTKYPGEQAIMINNREGVPTVNGNPHDPKGAAVADQTLTGVFIHQGNTGRASLTTTKGVAISMGCQTCGNGTAGAMNTFMESVPDNFKGSYYLRPMNVPASSPALSIPSISPAVMPQDNTRVVRPPFL